MTIKKISFFVTNWLESIESTFSESHFALKQKQKWIKPNFRRFSFISIADTKMAVVPPRWDKLSPTEFQQLQDLASCKLIRLFIIPSLVYFHWAKLFQWVLTLLSDWFCKSYRLHEEVTRCAARILRDRRIAQIPSGRRKYTFSHFCFVQFDSWFMAIDSWEDGKMGSRKP